MPMQIGSAFFDKFSLRGLVLENYPWARATPSGPGGGMGSGSGLLGQGKSSYHKSETFSCPIHVTGDDSFDEPRFVASLRSLLEQEIVNCQATISTRGNPGPSEFYVEYDYEDIHGRIDVLGKFAGTSYVLTAEINERGHGVRRLPDTNLKATQPQGEYHVVGIVDETSSNQDSGFLKTAVRLIKESLERMPRVHSKERVEDLQYAEVFSLIRIPDNIKRALEEQRIKLNIDLSTDPWEEYKGFEKVYFLNEVALRMYHDAGFEPEVLKKVSASEMPEQCQRNLRGLYVPKS